MNSGAARVAPEKAVFRPALPMSFMPGITEMHMGIENSLPLGDFTDAAGGKWLASLSVVESREPTVHLVSAKFPAAKFLLSSFLRPSPREDGFRFAAGGFPDDPVIDLLPLDTNYIASRALARLSALDGHYEIRWVPRDPHTPF